MQTPVWTPIRTLRGLATPLSLQNSRIDSILSSISSAIKTQATASSLFPLVTGSPKKTRIASPMNLSIVPPNEWLSLTFLLGNE